MCRIKLLGAASAAALCVSSGTYAQQAPIQGGGSTSAEFDYFVELPAFNASQPANGAVFLNPSPATGNNAIYWPSASSSGQAAFLNDDLTCDVNKVLNLAGAGGVIGACSNLPPTANGGTNFVDYAASDSTLTSTQIAQWASSTYGQSMAGNLIQIPSMGTGTSFPIVDNGNLSANGAVTLTDADSKPVRGVVTPSDLCGIFSGKIQNWNQTSFAGKIPDNPIQVVYRSDGSGATFLLLNHLSAVCNTTNSNFPVDPNTGKVAINVSNTFTNVFTAPPSSNPNNPTPPKPVPSNFLGEKGSSGVANYLSGQGGVAAPTSAIAYISPDWTTVDPKSNAVLADGSKSQLNVGAVLGTLSGKAAGVLPTEQNIATGLNHAKQGQSLKPPTSAGGFANPVNLVPVIQTVSQGYPVVGYTTFDLAQCYHNPSVGNAFITFLQSDHYQGTGTYATTEINNGLVPLAKSGAKTFVAAIEANILANKKGYNTNIQNGTVCAGVIGR